METAKLFQKDISSTEYKFWAGVLSEHSDAAVIWAFEAWNRNGKFFPRPAEILEHIHTFNSLPANKVQFCGKCDTGWISGFTDRAGNDAVKRCECVFGG